MKNKKSKIIVPALGLILLSTAASISGSVAWFTANRTGKVTAGNFAVVKTSDDLNVVLGAGVGTSVDNSTKAVTTTSGWKLADSSFNHADVTSTKEFPIVIPDTARTNIATTVPLASASTAEDGNMLRGATSAHIYSAFTWTMKFTVTFSGSAQYDQGLFIDLSDTAKTYMREKVTYTKEQIAADGGISATGLFVDEALGTAATADNGKLSASAYGTNSTYDFYKEAPDATGKAFRIAFVPTLIEGGTKAAESSKAYAKVWAANEGTAEGSGKYVSTTSGTLNAGTTTYSNTVAYLSGYEGNTSYSTTTAGADEANQKVFMKNNTTAAIPADNTLTDDTARGGNCNYLGYLKCVPGSDVSITFTCVAWFEGTHPEINGSTEDFENIVTSMVFGTVNLNS